jgi:predicted PurR-regulated permease PerM
MVTIKFYKKRSITTAKSIKSIMIGLTIVSVIGLAFLAVPDTLSYKQKVSIIEQVRVVNTEIEKMSQEELQEFAQRMDITYDSRLINKESITNILKISSDAAENSISIESYTIKYGGYVLSTGIFLIYVWKKLESLKTEGDVE